MAASTDEPALRRTAGPWLLWALGVGYVISGDYFGWNFGLSRGGVGGMVVATLVMASLYTCLVVSLAELASAMPVAGGPFAFARRAFGRWGGFATGTMVALEYTIAPAVIAAGIAGYVG
ncbi:MAG TPA: ethanolamine permease, partial [Nannocystaceae bacterium]|nr:ethanolamine permease [Nannocystaceae bacterium]